VPILLIDHDGPEAVASARGLELSGFRVTVVPSLDDGQTADIAAFDTLVLAGPGRLKERAARCGRLRKEGYTGVILAICSEVAEGEAFLDAGADDFVTTPFDPLELVTRIQARARSAAAHSRLRWGSLDLDRIHRVLRLRGKSIALTARECDLLLGLIEAEGQVVSRANLRERVWRGKEGASNLVEVHLSRLRDKLGADAVVIETVRRAGYRLRQ
jgi:DNA-binding response OmpR family regulator